MLVRALVASFALLSALSVVRPAARADGPSSEAKMRFEAGLASARSGAWSAALEAFTRCYELAPGPSVLFNLAGAQLRSGRWLSALSNYQRVAHSQDPRLTRVHRRAAMAQIEQIERHIPRVRIRVEQLEPQDRVLLDGQRLYPAELETELWVDPGEHELVVYRASAAQPEARHVVLVQGQHQYVSFERAR